MQAKKFCLFLDFFYQGMKKKSFEYRRHMKSR